MPQCCVISRQWWILGRRDRREWRAFLNGTWVAEALLVQPPSSKGPLSQETRMNLARRVVFSLLALAVSLAATVPVRADIKFNGSTVNPTFSMRFTIEGVKNPGACTPIVSQSLPPGTSFERYCLGPFDPANNKAAAR